MDLCGAGGRRVLSAEELSQQLDRLLQEEASDQRITEWVEANLEEQQVTSSRFTRALVTSVSRSAIMSDPGRRLDAQRLSQRVGLLQKHLCDQQRQLQALYALQALVEHMDQPVNLLRMLFDVLYDEEVIQEEAFYMWESSRDPEEQKGKGVALKSVTAFFTWLRQAEEED